MYRTSTPPPQEVGLDVGSITPGRKTPKQKGRGEPREGLEVRVTSNEVGSFESKKDWTPENWEDSPVTKVGIRISTPPMSGISHVEGEAGWGAAANAPSKGVKRGPTQLFANEATTGSFLPAPPGFALARSTSDVKPKGAPGEVIERGKSGSSAQWHPVHAEAGDQETARWEDGNGSTMLHSSKGEKQLWRSDDLELQAVEGAAANQGLQEQKWLGEQKGPVDNRPPTPPPSQSTAAFARGKDSEPSPAESVPQLLKVPVRRTFRRDNELGQIGAPTPRGPDGTRGFKYGRGRPQGPPLNSVHAQGGHIGPGPGFRLGNGIGALGARDDGMRMPGVEVSGEEVGDAVEKLADELREVQVEKLKIQSDLHDSKEEANAVVEALQRELAEAKEEIAHLRQREQEQELVRKQEVDNLFQKNAEAETEVGRLQEQLKHARAEINSFGQQLAGVKSMDEESRRGRTKDAPERDLLPNLEGVTDGFVDDGTEERDTGKMLNGNQKESGDSYQMFASDIEGEKGEVGSDAAGNLISLFGGGGDKGSGSEKDGIDIGEWLKRAAEERRVRDLERKCEEAELVNAKLHAEMRDMAAFLNLVNADPRERSRATELLLAKLRRAHPNLCPPEAPTPDNRPPPEAPPRPNLPYNQAPEASFRDHPDPQFAHSSGYLPPHPPHPHHHQRPPPHPQQPHPPAPHRDQQVLPWGQPSHNSSQPTQPPPFLNAPQQQPGNIQLQGQGLQSRQFAGSQQLQGLPFGMLPNAHFDGHHPGLEGGLPFTQQQDQKQKQPQGGGNNRYRHYPGPPSPFSPPGSPQIPVTSQRMPTTLMPSEFPGQGDHHLPRNMALPGGTGLPPAGPNRGMFPPGSSVGDHMEGASEGEFWDTFNRGPFGRSSASSSIWGPSPPPTEPLHDLPNGPNQGMGGRGLPFYAGGGPPAGNAPSRNELHYAVRGDQKPGGLIPTSVLLSRAAAQREMHAFVAQARGNMARTSSGISDAGLAADVFKEAGRFAGYMAQSQTQAVAAALRARNVALAGGGPMQMGHMGGGLE